METRESQVIIIRDNVSLAHQGTLRSISHWNIFLWGLFLLSLVMIFSTIATAILCYRQNPRYKWGWIILILIAYLSMGFSIIRTPNTWEFKVNRSAATVRLSRYVTYENGSREFRLFLPTGMAVYWIMKKRLDRESVHKKYGDRESGQEKRGNRESVHKKLKTRKPALRSVQTRKPALRSAQTRKPALRSVQTRKPARKNVQDRKPAMNSARIQTENPGVYLNCLKQNLTSQNRFLGEFGERF